MLGRSTSDNEEGGKDSHLDDIGSGDVEKFGNPVILREFLLGDGLRMIIVRLTLSPWVVSSPVISNLCLPAPNRTEMATATDTATENNCEIKYPD